MGLIMNQEFSVKKINVNLMLIFFIIFVFCNSCDMSEPEAPRLTAINRPPPPLPSTPILFYSQFGAKGDGKTCDFEAIRRTHEAANIRGAKVMGDPGAIYYIGAKTKTASIQTDVDWGDSRFIFDDTTIERRGDRWADSRIFLVESKQRPFPIKSVSSLQKGQTTLPLNLGKPLLLIAIDNTIRRYIRAGANEEPGWPQTDVFIVDADGNVDMRAPIIWDFNNITSLTAYPIDENRLTITGGHFTTIANRGTDRDQYMRRGIRITRSNVLLDEIFHEVIGQETLPVVAYSGFLFIENAANITVQNSVFTGRTVMNSKGTYDIQVNASVNISFINCFQTNDHTDTKYWGIMNSNYTKNITLDNVRWSRFDAHMGVHNVTIRNSDLGHQGIQIIGSGTLLVENTTVRGVDRFIQFRPDYGSTWEGNVYIKNCTFVLGARSGSIIMTQNNGLWNFGYDCFMPREIYIDGFHVVNSPGSVVQLVINNTLTNATQAANQRFPYTLTETIFIRNYRADNGLNWVINNQYLRDNIRIVTSWAD